MDTKRPLVIQTIRYQNLASLFSTEILVAFSVVIMFEYNHINCLTFMTLHYENNLQCISIKSESL